MRKRKYKLILLSLFFTVITLMSIVLPYHILDGQINSVSWKYVRRSDTGVSASDVAALYCDDSLRWSLIPSEKNADLAFVQSVASKTIREVFKSQEKLQSVLESLLYTEDILCGEATALIVMEGSPIALHGIEVNISTDQFTFHMLLEAKTNCCIHASLFAFPPFGESAASAFSSEEQFVYDLEQYFVAELGLSENSFYTHWEFLPDEEKYRAFWEFGLMMTPYQEEIRYEEDA